ncbi:MAG: hypothetical protein RR573_03945 [Oscillospiraceae bacterium]
MAERICFLGRGGSGKSTIAQNLGAALAQKGYHVLLAGMISLCPALYYCVKTKILCLHLKCTETNTR